MNQLDNKVIWDLEICKNIDLLKEADQIVLYGAGEKGRKVFEWLTDARISISGFCDNDEKKWGEYVEGVEIFSPYMLKKMVENQKNKIIYLVAAIQFPQELLDLIEHIGLFDICEVRLITFWGIKAAFQINAESIYGKQSKRVALLEIENKIRTNKIIIEEIDYLRKLVTADKDTVWLVQPGKTASSSLELRLKESNISFIKEHHLEYPNHILGEDCRHVWENIVKESRKSLRIISAVREPLARDYSAFWQVFTEGTERGMLLPFLKGDFQQMYNSYINLILGGDAYRKQMLGIYTPLTWYDEFEWFDEQIRKHLDVDIYQYPFDKERGYIIIKKGNIELFLFKVEKMGSILNEISSFVGAEKLSTINSNTAKQKWYGLAYAQFRKEVKLPDKYVEHYYCDNCKMDYFYTPKEKSAFLQKWKNNISNSAYTSMISCCEG